MSSMNWSGSAAPGRPSQRTTGDTPALYAATATSTRSPKRRNSSCRCAAPRWRLRSGTFYPDWITVPDLNLHLGAAHLQELLRRFGGRVEVAVDAYNAGPVPAARWLGRPGADDPDQFIELVPYQETRGYVRSVLRNRELYRALYVSPTN